jgi:hypothetical protein
MKRLLITACILHFALCLTAQTGYWQQHVKYTMNVDVDVNTNRFTGKQKLEYTNNSPDTLKRVFYHMYWNAFQPNSMMDARSHELGKKLVNGRPDWDSRVKDRISKLNETEIGYDSAISIKMNGVSQRLTYHETILEVTLTKPILPKSTVTFEVDFKGQVPVQIRRSGRDNAEGIRYSMSQWYPKMCEYDKEGWHPTPYVAREFYGIWGDYDVTINLDKGYKLAGTGVLQNAAEIGWGYDKAGTELKTISTPKRKWHFTASNVHDFVWAADPDYDHLVRKVGDITLNVIYKHVDSLQSKWNTVADAAVIVLPYMQKRFGAYPYPQYSFIQGGDGGMEYPMATLIKGPSLGTVFHEWMHSWYQMMMGTNESMYPWMDEGFTSYAEGEVSEYYKKATDATPATNEPLPLGHASAYDGYYFLTKSGLAEPLTTHADHYNTNLAYGVNSYSKGEIFLEQLGYIVSAQLRDKILLEYYKRWRFKHPNVDDFMKVAEDVSGIKLDWYKEYWVNTTKTIDYGIDSLWEENGVSKIRLKRVGEIPMPIDLELTFKDGSKEIHYIPMNLMFGEKPSEDNTSRTTHEEWRWTHPTYIVEFKRKLTDLKVVEIDPTRRMADVDRKNNLLQLNW